MIPKTTGELADYLATYPTDMPIVLKGENRFEYYSFSIHMAIFEGLIEALVISEFKLLEDAPSELISS